MTNNLCYRIKNKYEKVPHQSWIRVENPLGYYQDTVGLQKIKEHEYQYRESGYFKPILNAEFKLIRKDIAEIFLKYVPHQVELKEIKISRRATNETWNDYYEIKTKEHFKNSEYEKIICEDLSVFYIEDEIYVSRKLMEIVIKELNSIEIEFVKGMLLYA